jgi:hypothetical protein
VTLFGFGGIVKSLGTIGYQIKLATNATNVNILNMRFSTPGLDPAAGGGESSVIATQGVNTSCCIENNSFLDIPTNLGQRMHALAGDWDKCFVAFNYCPKCGGDIYNFNGGYNRVIGNVAMNGGDGGIAFNNGAYGEIVGNTIYRCGLGIGAGPQGTTANPQSLFTISCNNIDSCGYGINMGWFGYAGQEGPINVAITGNSITRCKTLGITYNGNSNVTLSKYINITGNVVGPTGTADFDGTTDPNAFGITMDYANDSVVSGNVVHDVPNSAIWFNQSPGLTITSNTIRNVGNTGIFGNGANTQFIISLNNIKAAGTGVSIGGGSTNFINTNNLVTP